MEHQRRVTPKRESPYQDQNQYPGAAQEQRSDLSDKNMSVKTKTKGVVQNHLIHQHSASFEEESLDPELKRQVLEEMRSSQGRLDDISVRSSIAEIREA